MSSPNLMKEIRKSLGMTQKELAQRCGISRPLITNIETGRIYAYPRARAAIAAALGVSEEVLWPKGGKDHGGTGGRGCSGD